MVGKKSCPLAVRTYYIIYIYRHNRNTTRTGNTERVKHALVFTIYIFPYVRLSLDFLRVRQTDYRVYGIHEWSQPHTHTYIYRSRVMIIANDRISHSRRLSVCCSRCRPTLFPGQYRRHSLTTRLVRFEPRAATCRGWQIFCYFNFILKKMKQKKKKMKRLITFKLIIFGI